MNIIVMTIVFTCFVAGCIAEQPAATSPVVQEPEHHYTMIHCPNTACENNRNGVTYITYGENRNYKISALSSQGIEGGKWVVPVVFLCEECGACWMQSIPT